MKSLNTPKLTGEKTYWIKIILHEKSSMNSRTDTTHLNAKPQIMHSTMKQETIKSQAFGPPSGTWLEADSNSEVVAPGAADELVDFSIIKSCLPPWSDIENHSSQVCKVVSWVQEEVHLGLAIRTSKLGAGSDH